MALPPAVREKIAYTAFTVVAPFAAGYFREELRGEMLHPLLLYASPGIATGLSIKRSQKPSPYAFAPALLAPLAYVAGRVARVLSQPETRKTLEHLLFP